MLLAQPAGERLHLGIMRKDQIFYGRAAGVGNPVIYVGAKTGRDGIHGATMASEEFGEEAQSKRPTVQVGDPFLEKLLLEACLEAMRAGAIVGIQDMGAAGLTSSSCEMGARAGQRRRDRNRPGAAARDGNDALRNDALRIAGANVDRCRRRARREVVDIFKKWELDAVVIGRVTDDGHLRVKNGGQIVADIPNAALTDAAPVYHRPLGKSSGCTSDTRSVRSKHNGGTGRDFHAHHRPADDGVKGMGLSAIRSYGANKHGQFCRVRTQR